jgi:Transposase protein
VSSDFSAVDKLNVFNAVREEFAERRTIHWQHSRLRTVSRKTYVYLRNSRQFLLPGLTALSRCMGEWPQRMQTGVPQFALDVLRAKKKGEIHGLGQSLSPIVRRQPTRLLRYEGGPDARTVFESFCFYGTRSVK